MRNLLRGLQQQTLIPDELVIGYMQEDPIADLPPLPCPVRTVHIPGDTLPLAKARNKVASLATGEHLIFLDVDCVPHPEMVADYNKALLEHPGIVLGRVLWLPQGAIENQTLDFERLERLGEHHAERPAPPVKFIEPCQHFANFWSLSFAVAADIFAKTGGFDEDFTGYGAEDTDYGRQLEELGIPIAWCSGAKSYHQYHSHHMPPVHHLESILHNNRVYQRKWNRITMDHWLYAFTLMGLIEERDGEYHILRQPNADDFALTHQASDRPYAYAGQVISQLEAKLGTKNISVPMPHQHNAA